MSFLRLVSHYTHDTWNIYLLTYLLTILTRALIDVSLGRSAVVCSFDVEREREREREKDVAISSTRLIFVANDLRICRQGRLRQCMQQWRCVYLQIIPRDQISSVLFLMIYHEACWLNAKSKECWVIGPVCTAQVETSLLPSKLQIIKHQFNSRHSKLNNCCI